MKKFKKREKLIEKQIESQLAEEYFRINYFLYIVVGGKDLNCYVGPQAPITNKSTSEEDKTFGKAP